MREGRLLEDRGGSDGIGSTDIIFRNVGSIANTDDDPCCASLLECVLDIRCCTGVALDDGVVHVIGCQLCGTSRHVMELNVSDFGQSVSDRHARFASGSDEQNRLMLG